MIPLWLYLVTTVALIVCLGVVAGQRERAQTDVQELRIRLDHALRHHRLPMREG